MQSFAFPGLSWLDLSIIIFYLVANATIGFVTFRKKIVSNDASKLAEEYILAGRTLTLPAFVATLVSTWYGGVIGVGEYVYDKGIVMWIVFGVPYYFAAIIYAIFLAHRVNNDRANSTLSDRLRSTYGERAGYIGSFVAFFMTSPAAYIMELATLYEWFFGLPYIYGAIVAIVTSIAYLFTGGFRGSVRADMLQFSVMFLGFGVIIPFAFLNLGGWTYVTTRVPATHLHPFGTFTVWYIIIWYIIALQTLVDPNVNTRVFAAKTDKVAKYGVLISVGFWLIFDLMTNIAGLYARAAFQNLPQGRYAYPALAEKVLPVGLKGVFYTGMLATVLSTVDSFFFTSATIVGRDILWRLRGNGDELKVKSYTRFGLLVTAVITFVVIMFAGHIYDVWYAFGSILVPALLLPLTLSYFPKLRPSSGKAQASMIIGGVTALIAYAYGVAQSADTSSPQYFLGMEPMYVGLFFSAIPVAIHLLASRGEAKELLGAPVEGEV